MHVEDIPLEILFQIFQMLEIEDLKAIVQVNRYFRLIGEDPSLWKSILIPNVHPDNLQELLSFPRLAKIQSLHLNSNRLSSYHFNLLRNSSNLKYLDISHCFLHEVDMLNDKSEHPSLCSKVMNNMEKLNINGTNLSISQYQKLFEDMGKCTKIRTLIVNTPECLEETDLSSINSQVLAKALARLVIVQISD